MYGDYRELSNQVESYNSVTSSLDTSKQVISAIPLDQEIKSVNFEVNFDGNECDKEDTRNMSKFKKWCIVIIISFTTFCLTCTLAAWTMASDHIIEYFQISHEVSVLGISLYVFGLGVGGIFLSPISEFHGRKVVYLISLWFSFAFQCLTSFGPNIGSVLFGRFMLGLFGSAFIGVAAGTLSDIFSKEEIHKPLLVYTISPFLGPGLLPVISGFINSHIDFKWTFYVMMIWTGSLAVTFLFVPETYPPLLLRKKAQRLRNTTGDVRYFAPIERDHTSIVGTTLFSCKRILLLISRDYMTLSLCFYTGLAQSVVYLFFIALPYIYKTVFGFSLQSQGMTFLGIVIGMVLTSFLSPSIFHRNYKKLVHQNGGIPQPEFKFIPLMLGVIVIPVGLFIMAWTSYSHLHWVGPIIGSGVFGGGVVFAFNGIIGYTLDAYRMYAASAIAANTLVRLVLSGIFPLFGLQMYEKLGVHWATSLVAFITCLMIPMPFLLYKYGPYLRSKSPYTWT